LVRPGAFQRDEEHVETEKAKQNSKQRGEAETVAHGHNQHGEDNHVEKRLNELSVVHCSQARNEGREYSSKRRTRSSLNNSYRHGPWDCGACSLQPVSDAGFAVNGSHHIAFTVFA